MSDTIVRSWNELTDAVFEGSLNEELGRYRSDFAFRGLANARWGLETSLVRLGGIYSTLEGSILRSFRKYALRDAVGSDSDWNWLTLAQHHGLPTRLLDWTFSPYVAMHFATCEVSQMREDAAIWCVNFWLAFRELPKSLRELLIQEYTKVFTVELLERAAPRIRKFDEEFGQHPFVLFFEPPSIDDRIVNQYALFSVMPGAGILLQNWLVDHPNLFKRIIIPAGLKWEIRDKLDQANINERTLFPGLDGLSSWLKRHYSPGPRGEQPTAQAAGTSA